MIYYRSDWPEVGLGCAKNIYKSNDLNNHLSKEHFWVHEAEYHGLKLKLAVDQNEFESQLYGFAIMDLYLKIYDLDNNVFADLFDSPILQNMIKEGVEKLVDYEPLDGTYLSCKLVKDEPLYNILLKNDFEQVEHRSIYACKIRDILQKTLISFSENIIVTQLSTINPGQVDFYQKYIFDMCRKVFSELFSRHFTDSLLLEKLPGIDYIIAVMELNFKQVKPENFFIAIDKNVGLPCGFSAVGKKPGLGKGVYTQLLSAVDIMYRGQGIYDKLTKFLSQTLPQDVTLLNVMQAGNQSIEKAYQKSGRNHLANTLVMRRFFHSAR